MQCPRHTGQQLGRLEWFRDGCLDLVPVGNSMGIPGEHNDRQIWRSCPNSAGHRFTVHIGHGSIQDHYAPAGVLFEGAQRLPPAISRMNLISSVPQDSSQQAEDNGLTINDQYVYRGGQHRGI